MSETYIYAPNGKGAKFNQETNEVILYKGTKKEVDITKSMLKFCSRLLK
ncbi:hypothetical protein OLQ22_09395 [Campylobacter jejuni]|nr:hypothetical protein [Campylobacter jejuni]